MNTPKKINEKTNNIKIELSDLYWYYTNDGSIVKPFVFSKQFDKIRSLNDGAIIPISDHDRSDEVIKFRQVAKSISRNLETLNGAQVKVKPTYQMLVDFYLKYGDSSAKTFFNPLLRKFRKSVHLGEHFNSNEFCKQYPPIDQKTIDQLTELFEKTIQNFFQENSKHSIMNTNDEHIQEFDF